MTVHMRGFVYLVPVGEILAAEKDIVERNEMKTQIVRKGRAWIVSAVLLAGLVYSVLALSTHIAYASTCDCNEELFDAQQYCYQYFKSTGVYDFSCQSGHRIFRCSADPSNTWQIQACD
jgi:hypothetical protein